jgi:hypothetical protein
MFNFLWDKDNTFFDINKKNPNKIYSVEVFIIPAIKKGAVGL